MAFFKWSVPFLLYLSLCISFWGPDQKLVSNVQGIFFQISYGAASVPVKITIICRIAGYTEDSQWIAQGSSPCDWLSSWLTCKTLGTAGSVWFCFQAQMFICRRKVCTRVLLHLRQTEMLHQKDVLHASEL